MPGGDGTGPIGQGPMSGRAAGFCAGYQMPGYANPHYGRGLGRGWGRDFGRGYWGRGRGLGWRSYYPEPLYRNIHPEPSREEEKTYLENLIKGLEEEIKQLQTRIKDLSNEDK